LGIGFDRLYPAFLFPGKSQVDDGELPQEAAASQRLLHYSRWSSWRQALQLIREEQPSGVIFTWWVSFWAPHYGWLMRHLPQGCIPLCLCHNVLPHEIRFFDPPLVRWALKPCRRFIVHSEDDRNQLLRLFPEARVLRREHPVYTAQAGSEISREAARRQLGIRGRMLLFFGFIRPYKGLDLALEALALLRDQFPDLNLWVAGEFWGDEKNYRDLIARLNLGSRVHLESGFLSEADLALRLGACDGVVLPYRSATGSGVLCTAYARNRPVIATRTGCFREMVIPGKSGILCEPGQTQSLAQAIREFYSGEGPLRFEAGVEIVKKQFSWEGILTAVEDLLEHE
jgi:glycosyltransferase involved in cell wall biosynthesis